MEAFSKETRIISLISGKGGVGKTALCSSMGTLLSQMGYKVLLVDFDFGTRGLTYFYINEIQNSDASETFILDEKIAPVRIRENLFFLSPISQFGKNLDPAEIDQVTDVAFSSHIQQRLESIITALKSSFDYIVFDTQAGIVPPTKACVELSDILVTLIEADPISIWAVKTLEHQFADSYSGRTKRIYYLVNKLFIEEAAQYNVLKNYLLTFPHLPPLPFDLEVRRAFARRGIPIKFDEPSAFVFAMLRLIRELIPGTKNSVRELEKQMYQQAMGPINSRINTIIEQIQETQLEFKRAQNYNHGIRLAKVAIFFYIVTLIIFLIVSSMGRPEILSFNNTIVILLIGSFGVFLGVLFLESDTFKKVYQYLKPTHRSTTRDIGILRQEHDDLMKRKRNLEMMFDTQ